MMVLGQYRAVRLDSSGSVWSRTGWYMRVLGQFGAILVGTWWYWVSITWCCLELSGTGLIWGFDACIYWKKGDLVACYHSGTNERRTRKDRATQPLDHGRPRWAVKVVTNNKCNTAYFCISLLENFKKSITNAWYFCLLFLWTRVLSMTDIAGTWLM